MSIRPDPIPDPRAALTPGSLDEAQRSFRAVLGKAVSPAGPLPTLEEQAREAARDLVSATFVTPLLKQFRDSDRTPAPFGPTSAEKQFRALMDADLARNLVKAGRFPLVERLAQDLLRRSGAPAQRPPQGTQEITA